MFVCFVRTPFPYALFNSFVVTDGRFLRVISLAAIVHVLFGCFIGSCCLDVLFGWGLLRFARLFGAGVLFNNVCCVRLFCSVAFVHVFFVCFARGCVCMFGSEVWFGGFSRCLRVMFCSDALFGFCVCLLCSGSIPLCFVR